MFFDARQGMTDEEVAELKRKFEIYCKEEAKKSAKTLFSGEQIG